MSYSPNFTGNIGNASKQIQSNYVNGNGGTISRGTCVSTNTSGLMVPTDITNVDSALAFIGILNENTPNAASGVVVSAGRFQNIANLFSIGDPVYIDITGSLTNVKPDLTTPGYTVGDTIIFLGVVVKNEFNPLQKDIQMMVSLIGVL